MSRTEDGHLDHLPPLPLDKTATWLGHRKPRSSITSCRCGTRSLTFLFPKHIHRIIRKASSILLAKPLGLPKTLRRGGLYKFILTHCCYLMRNDHLLALKVTATQAKAQQLPLILKLFSHRNQTAFAIESFILVSFPIAPEKCFRVSFSANATHFPLSSHMRFWTHPQNATVLLKTNTFLGIKVCPR